MLLNLIMSILLSFNITAHNVDSQQVAGQSTILSTTIVASPDLDIPGQH